MTLYLISLAVILLSRSTVVKCQHIWYNDNGSGDILINEVMVDSTATTSYYETLGWNQGGVAGGYTGMFEIHIESLLAIILCIDGTD